MTLQELEETVSGLPPEDLAKSRWWFLAFDAKSWDQQFEADVAAGWDWAPAEWQSENSTAGVLGNHAADIQRLGRLDQHRSGHAGSGNFSDVVVVSEAL